MIEAQLTRGDFLEVAALLHAEARIALAAGKARLVQSRLARRLRATGARTFAEYLAVVRTDGGERSAMVTALTTNHTSFFREAHHFDHLRAELLPRLRRKAERGEPVRIWSAGCSSGEEIYSVAMCLLGPDRDAGAWLRGRDVRLLATDIAPPMVEATARATYLPAAIDSVPPVYRSLWLREAEEEVQVAPEARALVWARELNLFSNPWPMRGRFDAIFCRNVMIYFDEESKAELEQRLLAQLAPGGFLYLGHSERLTGPAATAVRPCGQTIYAKGDGAA